MNKKQITETSLNNQWQSIEYCIRNLSILQKDKDDLTVLFSDYMKIKSELRKELNLELAEKIADGIIEEFTEETNWLMSWRIKRNSDRMAFLILDILNK